MLYQWCCIMVSIYSFVIFSLWPQVVVCLLGCIAFLPFLQDTFLKLFKTWGDIALTWCILHFFSLPSTEATITVLSLTIFIILWSAKFLGWKVDAAWFFIKTSCPILKFDALLNFLLLQDPCPTWCLEVILHAAATYFEFVHCQLTRLHS